MISISSLLSQFKDSKICIDGLLVDGFSSKLSSHKGAWAALMKNHLEHVGFSNITIIGKDNKWEDFEVIFFLPSMEFKGAFNVFGGVTEEHAQKFQRFLNLNIPMFILDAEMPDLGAFITSRSKSDDSPFKKLNAQEYTEKSKQIHSVNTFNENSKTFVLGDSHSVSAYIPGANILRLDGQTLYGVLRKPFDQLVPRGIEHLVTYFGNIDIRHHLCRQENPKESLLKLLDEYVKELLIYKIPKLSIVNVLPIEYEARPLPSTGFYKGTPFYGSIAERKELVSLFNEGLHRKSIEYGFSVIEWPASWYTMDPQEYAEKYMEKPRSVHLSREFYQYDFVTSQKNPKLQEVKNNPGKSGIYSSNIFL